MASNFRRRMKLSPFRKAYVLILREEKKFSFRKIATMSGMSKSSAHRTCIGNSMVSSAIWKKHARVSFSKKIEIARVKFEVFEKLTSVCFFKLHEKPYYYLLIIYTKKFRVNNVHSHRHA